jgi:hypothetical protein
MHNLKIYDANVRQKNADQLSTPSLFRLMSRRDANQARAIAFEAARAVVG